MHHLQPLGLVLKSTALVSVRVSVAWTLRNCLDTHLVDGGKVGTLLDRIALIYSAVVLDSIYHGIVQRDGLRVAVGTTGYIYCLGSARAEGSDVLCHGSLGRNVLTTPIRDDSGKVRVGRKQRNGAASGST